MGAIPKKKLFRKMKNKHGLFSFFIQLTIFYVFFKNCLFIFKKAKVGFTEISNFFVFTILAVETIR